jgi:serine/threonine protein kinase
MERQLAVKRFHPQLLAMPGVSGRLSQAARTYGGLDHPRLARLAELGVAGGETFTAVEWVNGLDLARLLTMSSETSSPLPPGASLALLSAAARAVGYAHGRGVSHLGLSPTNIIATPDGDVKVTDVGILACRLGARPASDPSLAARVPYLAPEQLIGEPVSAASDVFVLGAIAYELIAGVRPFGGATPPEIEQAVLSGRPTPLELPRPLVRVIDRCLARSPFERFPDARALADALDAALRLSPLAGARRDLGERVAAALEHIARVNEQQLSGALSFAVPTAPPRPGTGGSLPLPPPSRTGGIPAMPRPRPPAVSPPMPNAGHTLRSMSAPPVRLSTERTSETTLSRGAEPDESNLSVGDDTVPRIEPMWPPTEQVQTLRPPSATRTIAVPPPPPPMRPIGSNPPPFDARRPAVLPEGSPPSGSPPNHGAAAGPPHGPPMAPPHGPPMGPPQGPPHGPPQGPPHGPPMGPPHGPPMGPPMMTAPMGGMLAPPPPPDVTSGRAGKRVALVLVVVVVLAGLGVGGFFLYRELERRDGGTGPVASVTHDGAAAAPADDADGAGPAIAAADAAGAAEATDAAAVEPVGTDGAAAAATGPDAADPDDDVDAGTDESGMVDPGDKLVIQSDPPEARVFVDGADQGKTPVTISASSDRLGVAVVLSGYDLYLQDIDGKGVHLATLVAVSPPEGPAGIKVRCKDDDRYYVYLDEKPTGQMCPTERLGVAKGEHEVEVYDLVSETRRRFTARVKETRVSVRVRVD